MGADTVRQIQFKKTEGGRGEGTVKVAVAGKNGWLATHIVPEGSKKKVKQLEISDVWNELEKQRSAEEKQRAIADKGAAKAGSARAKEFAAFCKKFSALADAIPEEFPADAKKAVADAAAAVAAAADGQEDVPPDDSEQGPEPEPEPE